MLAANLDMVDGIIARPRLVFGGMACTPKRATKAESLLLGSPPDIETFKKAAKVLPDDFKPLSDMRGSADYRMTPAQNLLVKYGLELSEGKYVHSAIYLGDGRLADIGPGRDVHTRTLFEIDEPKGLNTDFHRKVELINEQVIFPRTVWHCDL